MTWIERSQPDVKCHTCQDTGFVWHRERSKLFRRWVEWQEFCPACNPPRLAVERDSRTCKAAENVVTKRVK